MTRTFIAALLTAGLAAPAIAQTTEGQSEQGEMLCSQEASAIWAAVEQSQLQDSDKSKVAQVLEQAQAEEQRGNTAGCAQIVEQVKVALGMQPPSDAAPAPAPQ